MVLILKHSLILLFVWILFVPQVQAQFSHRFRSDQLEFYIQDNDGGKVTCKHELLSHVPWWKVTCGNRSYTVDTWMQVLHHKQFESTRVTLMMDVSEGVDSSGEKLVQFQSHFTSFILKSLTSVEEISSSLDVRNGQASLVLKVKL